MRERAGLCARGARSWPELPADAHARPAGRGFPSRPRLSRGMPGGGPSAVGAQATPEPVPKGTRRAGDSAVAELPSRAPCTV